MKKFEEDIDALVPSLSQTTTASMQQPRSVRGGGGGAITAEQRAQLMFLQSQGLSLEDA